MSICKHYSFIKNSEQIIARETEDEFLDVIGAKVLRVFLLAIHNHLNRFSPPPPPPPSPPKQKWFETGCNVNIVYGNLTVSMITLKIMPRNLNKFVHS
jgi:hypothetical protein